jgi:hypothetical protein
MHADRAAVAALGTLVAGAAAFVECSGGRAGTESVFSAGRATDDGGTDAEGGDTGPGAPACTASTVFTQGAAKSDPCVQCLESHCSAPLDGYADGCSDYIDCVCVGGPGVQACAQKASDSSCIRAAAILGACIEVSCVPQCIPGSDGGVVGAAAHGAAAAIEP